MINRRKSFILLNVLATLLIIYSCSTEPTPVYNLTTSATPAEAGSVSPASAQANESEQIQITATANEHWVFSGWQGALSGTTNPVSILMDSDKTVTALFEKLDYPLTVTVNDEEGGHVEKELVSSKTTDYPHASVVELTAIASDGWEFSGWSGDVSGLENPEAETINVTISGPKNITANFEQVVVVTVEGDGEVNIELLDDASSNGERRVRATAIADENWVFHQWSGDISSFENPIEFTIADDMNSNAAKVFNITDMINIEAGFAAEVTNPTTGRIWMDRNLGASRVATSRSDEVAYGDLFQWGRAADGHQNRNSPTTTTRSSTDNPDHGNFILPIYGDPLADWRASQNNNLWQGENGINNPCPNGYRLPIDAEWEEERISWSSDDLAGAFASPLKLPATGRRGAINGMLIDIGSRGFYWSSSIVENSPYANGLMLKSSENNGIFIGRGVGLSVRCIKD